MTHTISVIQPHIDNGTRRSASDCPLALALIQHFGRSVCVAKIFFWFEDEETLAAPPKYYINRTINLPTVAIKFQNDFDRGFKTLSPFTFQITINN
jgi:hypothetical protein